MSALAVSNCTVMIPPEIDDVNSGSGSSDRSSPLAAVCRAYQHPDNYETSLSGEDLQKLQNIMRTTMTNVLTDHFPEAMKPAEERSCCDNITRWFRKHPLVGILITSLAIDVIKTVVHSYIGV